MMQRIDIYVCLSESIFGLYSKETQVRAVLKRKIGYALHLTFNFNLYIRNNFIHLKNVNHVYCIYSFKYSGIKDFHIQTG